MKTFSYVPIFALFGIGCAIAYLLSNSKGPDPLLAPSVVTIPEIPERIVTFKKTAKATTKQVPSSPLKRFEKLQTKVLLTNEETKERNDVLSDLKTIEWISKRLTDSKEKIDLAERLTMIDFLEGSLAWKDNPVGKEVLQTIKSIIESENYLGTPRAVKRQFIGDKIELFAILWQELPDEASALTERARGTNLEAILDFATSRLSLKKIKYKE